MIKSVLNSILIFYLSFFKIPKKVIEILVRLQRRFLWGAGVDEFKTAWVKWETVCLPNYHGGLGVRDLELINMALLGKWKWSMLQEDDTIWNRILVSKYGGWRVLDLERVNQPESLWWRDLKKSCGASAVGEWFNKGMKLKIGCWSRVNFWTDKWTGGPELLGEKFPCLFVLFEQQNCKVAWMGFMWGSSWEWTFVWRRNSVLVGEFSVRFSG